MASKWSAKDPGDTRDYRIDWTGIVPVDDPITASVYELPDDLELVDDTFDDITTTFRVSGGVVGDQYSIDNTVTTTSGQIFHVDAVLKVAERIVKGVGVK
jgi:hypothetical protein